MFEVLLVLLEASLGGVRQELHLFLSDRWAPTVLATFVVVIQVDVENVLLPIRIFINWSGDFKSSSGPDLYIYVGNGSPTKRIAKLKRNSGAQTYTFSGTAPISSVHVYCKRFSVGFGTAKLN